MISLTDVLFSVLLQRVAGEAGEHQPHNETAPSHFDLRKETRELIITCLRTSRYRNDPPVRAIVSRDKIHISNFLNSTCMYNKLLY